MMEDVLRIAPKTQGEDAVQEARYKTQDAQGSARYSILGILGRLRASWVLGTTQDTRRKIQDARCRMHGLRFRVRGCKTQDAGFRVQGLGM